jgi:DAK2 domain fusion protein YloV
MERIDAVTLKRMMLNAAAAIENNKQEINELNVFPVPDGDTGTNMSLTIISAANELRQQTPQSVEGVADIAAHAMVRGARGNSGVILSLLFRGFGKHLKGKLDITGKEFAEAMSEGVKSAYKAVMKPAEGTILTVSRVASNDAVTFAEENESAAEVIAVMLRSAEEALAKTVNQNPTLQKAGVIDAGAKGFCEIIAAMYKGLCGEEIISGNTQAFTVAAANFSDFDAEDITFGYCTEFIINIDGNSKKSSEKLRAYLDSLGDSLVFVEDEDIIKIHVHTNDPGKAIQKGLEYGSLTSIKIDNMRVQHTEKVIITGMGSVVPGTRYIAEAKKRYGVVAICAGEGIRDVLKDIGADQIVEGGQTMNPSTEDILRAIDATPAEIVFVFPNNKNIIMAAEQCVSMSVKQVVVIPTKTVPQGIAALLAFDPETETRKNRDVMLKSIQNVRTGQITYAARDSMFDEKRIKKGDYLAILDGELTTNTKVLPTAIKRLARDMNKCPAEFITIFCGKDVPEENSETVREIFEKEFKTSEVSVIYGGQPVYQYLISAE